MTTNNDIKSLNFEFLKPEVKQLAQLGGLAETLLYVDPGSSLTRLRSFAEEVVKLIYKHERLPRMPQSSFYELLNNQVFEDSVSRSLIHQIHFLRVKGNESAHGGKGSLRDAQMAIGIAHQVATYFGIKYLGRRKQEIEELKDVKNPTTQLNELQKSVSAYEKELDKQQQELEEVIKELERERTLYASKLPEPSDTERKQRQDDSSAIADSLQWDEEKTRLLLIDSLLEKASWDTSDPNSVGQEIEVDFPANPSGKGYVDYVLWDDNGQPLAVVEAKRSGNESLHAGREQARLYADAFERMGKQRPVIFYTNGYETFIWDDAQYNTYRRVYGIYSKDSLQYLIYQRKYREPQLERFNPDMKITERPYQIEGIKTVAAHFQNQRRKALIIQATGTGKTRVSIALAELLSRTGWAKRVLFLCDRKELRTQADDAFKEHLGSEPRCVIGEKGQIDQDARIYIATYPGMMNRFAQLDVGFFDLIIADESHRSIYNKYRDLFDYFDALQIGLTATPVKFISRNTFDMFDCENLDPTFEFGLEEAIEHEPPYLVPFRVRDLTTDFLRDGIHYNDLSDEQKRQLEEDLGLEEAQNTTIAGKDIGRKIFSESTDKIILENLMDNGIKDETGSLVGKTIIFAQRQDHAEHLEELFCKLYPQYGPKVCKVIHNRVPHVESLIKEFKKSDNQFRIAISVDMLDTGIDAPDVVNLVFAKPVKSWVKFWQMIGRGTRLRPNLFGPGKDKSEFLIFDHYGNFDFFEQEYKEPENPVVRPLLQTTFEARVALAQSALKNNHSKAFDIAINQVKADLADLPEESIAVKRELRKVHQLLQTDALQKFDARTQHLLMQTVAPLMAARVLRDKHASQFDRLIAEITQCFVERASCLEDGKEQLITDISALPMNIQRVRQKSSTLQEVQSASFWKALSIDELERVRTELRGIMKYRKSAGGSSTGTSRTNTQDDGIQITEREVSFMQSNEVLLYRRRLKAILKRMVEQNPTLQKVRDEQPVTDAELKMLTSTILTNNPGVSLEVLNEFYGRTANQLQLTLRELVGLDAKAVDAHLTKFLREHPTLTAQQVKFLNLLKQYIAEHGSIMIDTLYEAPFTSVSHEGVDGVFPVEDVDELITAITPFLKTEGQSQEVQE